MHALQLHNFEGMLFEDMNPLDDEDNRVSLGCVTHRIRVKVKIVRIMSCIRFSIHVGFVPNGLFGSGSFSGVGYH